MRHHLEDALPRAATDEAHPAGVAGRRRSEGRAADGYRESPCRRSHRANDNDFCRTVAGRQRRVIF